MDQTIEVADGRTVGFVDYGAAGATAVLWCHGGPGSRYEPRFYRHAANEAGLRLVGIDRPGYGLSTPQPGRKIAGWVSDAIAVADRLRIERFVTVGVSTGGAYALAVAALVPERVLGVVRCCSVTDMRHLPARASMHHGHTHALWDAPNREAAIAAGDEAQGVDGSKMLNGGMNTVLAPSDVAVFQDPAWMKEAMSAFPHMFTFGNQGFADDRIADGVGWVTFDVDQIRCPVAVLHGGSDMVTEVVHARHTAAIVPDAQLRIVDDLGNFSIEAQIVPTITSLLDET